ncbi:VOC family protein [Devosia sp. 63-57]|uniref:VOC family protein n=1 Tax=Devosia sp. 63-57 TaxID=1895751 RepID=UPI00086878A2|nr:VOC family protein [Devosia sp. 63-57]ODT48589.1 MAG: lactoylglutathione lyase [Pelagibacterium sp. SCN 63-126]ODU80370.1 MAG: lactoylglutathione lyase [Pelagibacterium sp. SCN 63-17]OJX44032.1 MAG: lactoylglutathione lyase [Devosia sp. 63-57]
MQFHTGRLIDHVHLRARDFSVTSRFYQAILAALDIKVGAVNDTWLQVDELFIDAADADTIPSHIHLAFQAKDEAMVHRFYEAALAAGGKDNGAPGERHYHPGYFACFIIDPDGNNIEAVYHGPSTRSAASVTIEPTA